MKYLYLTIVLLLAQFTCVMGQNEFKKEWQSKVSVEPKWNAYTSDLSLILVGDLKEIQMLDGNSGKPLWKLSAKDKFGVKSFEDWFFLTDKEGEPVKVLYKKPKDSQTSAVLLNPRTGEPLPSQNLDLGDKAKKYIPSKSVFATSAFDEPSGTFLSISYDSKLIKSATKGTELDLTVEARGGYKWSAKIKGRAVRHLCDIMLSSNEPDMMMNIFAQNDKVFVVYEGISVLDLRTGKVLWNTSFDNVQTSLGLKVTQEIGRSAMPVTDAEGVYVCDFSKGEKSIKKLDINTGKVIWEGQKLSDNDVVSQLLIVDHVLIAKFGGTIRKELYIPSSTGGLGAGTYKVKFDYEGASSIRAYDLSSGRQIWSADQLKDNSFNKSECSILQAENQIIACSNESFYSIDAKTGNVVRKINLNTKAIGKPLSLFSYNNSYIVKGEEGIASVSGAGNKNFETSTGKALFDEFRGQAYIVWTGKDVDDLNEFVRLDLNTGKISGKLKGCYNPRFDTTGDYFLRFNNEEITKYKTN